jgi:hypothetical protein
MGYSFPIALNLAPLYFGITYLRGNILDCSIWHKCNLFADGVVHFEYFESLIPFADPFFCAAEQASRSHDIQIADMYF